ncbi:4'-phosphopantetheinyl transferase family protein [Streptomyces sp. NPDC001606]
MISSPTYPLTGGHVVVWWASVLGDLSGFFRILSSEEKNRLTQYRSDVLAAEFVTAAVLRVALGRHAGTAPGDVRVERRCPDCFGHHGRPRPLDSPELDVSVAHAGGRVAVAVAHGMRTGVDVEQLARVADACMLCGHCAKGCLCSRPRRPSNT